MIGALVFLILVISTNYSMICFICHGLYIYGAWLNKYHKVDLWLLRVLVSITSVEYLHHEVYSSMLKEQFTKNEYWVIICSLLFNEKQTDASQHNRDAAFFITAEGDLC